MKELIVVLKELDELLAKLCDLAQSKREIIIHGEVEALETLTREESGLIAQVDHKESQRQRMVLVHEVQAGRNAQSATLLSLIEALPQGSDRATLAQLREELTQHIEALNHSNDINRQLLQTQAEIASYALESVTRPTQLGTHYSSTGADTLSPDTIALFDKDA